MQDDFQIMNHQIENDTNVGATLRVRPEPVRFDEPRMRQMFFKSVQDRVETFHMADLQDHAVTRGQVRELGGVHSVISDRLLDQHMLVLRKQSARNCVVRVGGRCYGSRINHPNEFIERPGGGRAEFGCNSAIRNRIHIIHGSELSGRSLRIQSRVIASDMTNPNNAYAQIFHPLRAVNPESFRGQRRKDSWSTQHQSYATYATDHCAKFATNQSYVAFMPSCSVIAGLQPNARIFETSKSLRGVPSGLVVSQASWPSKPTTWQINSASSPMEMSSPQPTLIISGESYFSKSKRHAAARSSTCKNSRRGFPVPHTTSLRSFRVLASCALRNSAARTCEVSRSKLSFGP